MLKTEREKRICAKYSAYDDTGHVHCNECPLRVVDWKSDLMCKATAHYDRRKREWVYDHEGKDYQMKHTTDEFLRYAGMDDKADEMRRQMEEQEQQQPDVRELVEENCRLTDQVHNLTLYLDYVRRFDHALFGAMMDEFDGMPGYGGLPTREGVRNV